MGKLLRQQRRGKGSPTYRSPSHRFLGKVSYGYIPKEATQGLVKDILDAPGRSGPLAKVEFAGKNILHLPSEGTRVGQIIDFESPTKGNIVELSKIPEGSSIFNIELHPNDGGKLCRASGSFATLITKEEKKCMVILPSKQKKVLSLRCRATIGVAAGSGRTDKPFRKAGNKHHAMKAKNKYYPTTSAGDKNAVDHPFGGSNQGKHKSTSRHMPPGKKVGAISPRRTGRKRGKR